MAYDSAAAIDAANRAYQRAVAIAETKRAQLNQQYGLDSAGGLTNDPLGSIYRGNVEGTEAMESAEYADRSRGFGSAGLGGKQKARVARSALANQALGFRNAAAGIAGTEQEKLFADQDRQGQFTQIDSNARADLAETLRRNQILADEKAAQAAYLQSLQRQVPASAPGFQPTTAAMLKANPRAAQVARNNRY